MKCWRATAGGTGCCSRVVSDLRGGAEGLRSRAIVAASRGADIGFLAAAAAGTTGGFVWLASVTFGVVAFPAFAFLVNALLAAAFLTVTFFTLTFAAALFAIGLLAVALLTVGLRAVDLLAAFLAAFFPGARLAAAGARVRAVLLLADVLRADAFFDLLGLIAHLRSSARTCSRVRNALSIKIRLYAS